MAYLRRETPVAICRNVMFAVTPRAVVYGVVVSTVI